MSADVPPSLPATITQMVHDSYLILYCSTRYSRVYATSVVRVRVVLQYAVGCWRMGGEHQYDTFFCEKTLQANISAHAPELPIYTINSHNYKAITNMSIQEVTDCCTPRYTACPFSRPLKHTTSARTGSSIARGRFLKKTWDIFWAWLAVPPLPLTLPPPPPPPPLIPFAMIPACSWPYMPREGNRESVWEARPPTTTTGPSVGFLLKHGYLPHHVLSILPNYEMFVQLRT